MRILGLDPGLRRTGWGLVEARGSRLSHVDNGVISVSPTGSLAQRLHVLHTAVLDIVDRHMPEEVAVEETFVNKNPASTLKLGQARGVVMLAPAARGIEVAEYSPNRIKKALTGTGHAAKEQMGMMVRTLLPGSDPAEDAADALAVAVCHAHYRSAPRYEKKKKETV